MEETEKAYLAGLFDGEGTIALINFKNKQLIRIKIALDNKETIQWAYNKIKKGSFYSYIPKGQPKRTKKYKELFTIQITGVTATKFLKEILPYLKVKKSLVQLALMEAGKAQTFKGNYISLIKLLKERRGAT